MLDPVLATTTTGFLFPNLWLLSPDDLPIRSLDILVFDCEPLGIETATSSLNRVVAALRGPEDSADPAGLLAFGKAKSEGSWSSSETMASSSSAIARDLSCGDVEDDSITILDDRLDPELVFLRMGGGRVVLLRLFSFDSLDVATSVSGLVGVGVTELSSLLCLPNEGPAFVGSRGEILPGVN